MKGLKTIIQLLTARERRNGLLLLAMIIIMAFMETAGVASVMPFLAVLGNPEIVQENSVLEWLYTTGSFTSTDSFLFALGLASLAMIVFAALWRGVTQWTMAHYAQMRNHSLSVRLLSAYLHQPYEFFLSRNSSDLSKAILSEVQMFILNVLQPAMNLVAYGLVALVLLVFLFTVNFLIASLTALVVVGTYGLAYVIVRGFTDRNGRARVAANRSRFAIASEALGGIKEVKVFGMESPYLQRFIEPSKKHARYLALNSAIRQVPRYVIEAIGFGGIIVLTLFLMQLGSSLGELLPIIGLYAFAGYRLLPALQNIFGALVQLRFGMPAAETLAQDLAERELDSNSPRQTVDERKVELRESIKLESLSFKYRGAEKYALQGINIEIPAKSSLGIVGATGAGKSTLVDLILALVRPNEGRILVDNESLPCLGVERWRAALGYVPQHIYLADDTIATNIAFGQTPDTIDRSAVVEAAKLANLHDFIMCDLPKGYDTVVGERGVRLSGGQRQRIGIARALYRDPSVLVFDEATSALDNHTESEIMRAVSRLKEDKTLIIIAHRLSTVRDCDQILYIDQGRVAGIGDFETLYGDNQAFRGLVGNITVR